MAKVAAKDKFTPKEICQRMQRLESDRGTAESHWQEIADFIYPNKSNITRQYVTEGEKRFDQLLDNTGVQSNELLAGFLHGNMTSSNAEWFEMTTGDNALDAEDDVRVWLQDTATDMHAVLNDSNFHTEKNEMDLDQCAFGTGCMLMEEDPEEVVRFKTNFIADYYLDEDTKGRVNQIYRKWKWPVEKLVEEFGFANLPRRVQQCFEKKDYATEFCVIHATYPKKLANVKAKGQAFVTQYIIKEEEFEVKDGSFESLPYLTPRWSKASGEKYGRGPGSVALPECKVLNKMNETMLIGAQKIVDPPVQLPDDGFILPLITRPGGVNYRRNGNPDDIIRPIFADTRLDFGYQALEDRRKRIRDAFYVDQLRLQQSGPMMTATEVMARTEEQSRLLGPMLGRQQTEFLKPLIDRLFRIMWKRGLIKPPPAVLEGRAVGVRYSSFIARTQRVNEGQNTLRYLQAVTPFIQMDNSVADNLDGDYAARALANIYNPPQKIIRSQKDTDKRRAEKAQQREQMEQQLAMSQQMAAGAQTTQAVEAIGGAEQAG